MVPSRQQGSIPLFRFAGIQVYLHWYWFVAAFYELSTRRYFYSSPIFNLAEYLALFGIVLLHEFGHALACRQVGGQADSIVLWPLGGVAYVSPPRRPGATLWSIAAGPLVNVVLWPVLSLAVEFARAQGLDDSAPDTFRLLRTVGTINISLLVFNILPIYPLDGGQILGALFWFFVGQGRSLIIASVIGFVGAAAIGIYAVYIQNAHSLWTGLIALFMFQQCLSGFRYGRALRGIERTAKHDGLACPKCHASPPKGPFHVCGHCRRSFDQFATGGICPECQTANEAVRCVFCGETNALPKWWQASSVRT